MTIIHFTNHRLFLGGGERLGFNWVENSIHPSLYYSRSGGVEYTKSPRFRLYEDDSELCDIALAHKEDLIVLHDPFVAGHPCFSEVTNLLWFVHGAFAFQLDVSQNPRPKFVLSNYLPKTTHKSWNGITIFPVQLGIEAIYRAPSIMPENNKIVVGVVGRISPEKIPLFWFDFLVKFNKSPSLAKIFEFRFYGKGVEDSDYYREFILRQRRIHNARYMGEIDKDRMMEIYHSLDLMMVPSLTETGSYAIVEAQACGLRVLALDSDGISNHIEGQSILCLNYDDMFHHLSLMTKRDDLPMRQNQSLSATSRHRLVDWVSKMDSLAHIANLP